jgi:hypothetical protein
MYDAGAHPRLLPRVYGLAGMHGRMMPVDGLSKDVALYCMLGTACWGNLREARGV